MKPCTIKVTNKGRKLISSASRGFHFVTLLETVITDDETGAELNRWISHSDEQDTLAFPVFYKPGAVSDG